MPNTHEILNGSKAEAVANTLVYESYEVPNSYGAQSVFVKRTELDPTFPTVPPGANGLAATYALAQVGKQIPTTATLAMPGAFATARIQMHSAGAGVPACIVIDGPGIYIGPLPVPRDADGKYYVTICVTSVGDVALCTCSFHFEFVVTK